jgi:hypothetical protein
VLSLGALSAISSVPLWGWGFSLSWEKNQPCSSLTWEYPLGSGSAGREALKGVGRQSKLSRSLYATYSLRRSERTGSGSGRLRM